MITPRTVTTYNTGDVRRRMKFVVAAALLGFLAVVARIVFLQVSKADELRAAGIDQRTQTITIDADRGSILDRNGQELALSVPMPSVVADPAFIIDAPGTADLLVSALALSVEQRDKLVADFGDPSKRFVYVARFVEADAVERVMAMNLPGVSIISEDKRVLPSGEVGVSIVGRTDPWGEPLGGIEMRYNEMLTGIEGTLQRERLPNGDPIPGSDLVTQEPVAGTDLMLTISRPLQYEVEQAILAQVEALAAHSGRVIVMDTTTGDILAEANVLRGDDGVARVTSANLAVVEANEPGSTAKVFSIAAALNEGVVAADSSLYVPDRLVFNEGSEKWEQTIFDAKPHPPQMMTVRDIVVNSSNIGTWLASQGMPSSTYEQYLRSFGFGEPTALGLSGESAGVLAPSEEWYGSQRATVTYGYGLQVTSQQLVAAVNTIANGGVYVEPRIIKATVDDDGVITEAAPSGQRQVVSAETAAQMTDILSDVVCDPNGTGNLAQIDGITVAGKTGTGYKIQDNGTYEGANGERDYFATFVGFLPADDPQITILVSIDQPNPNSQDRFGGTAAAPTFAKVAEASIRSLGISPAIGDSGCAG
jgi:cell division protein FtsI (penicillin-binding protein 3)